MSNPTLIRWPIDYRNIVHFFYRSKPEIKIRKKVWFLVLKTSDERFSKNRTEPNGQKTEKNRNRKNKKTEKTERKKPKKNEKKRTGKKLKKTNRKKRKNQKKNEPKKNEQKKTNRKKHVKKNPEINWKKNYLSPFTMFSIQISECYWEKKYSNYK